MTILDFMSNNPFLTFFMLWLTYEFINSVAGKIWK
jgi:hypothetical protein